MLTSQACTGRRVALSYSVEGLPMRDELLLKSLVRVLDHRSHQQWQCVEAAADLRVTGAPFGASALDGQGGAVLRLGFPPGTGEYELPMPIHAGQLEAMFNRIGDQLAQARAAVAAIQAQQPLRGDEAFKLRRWPPASLVATPERRSLAALMSVRAHSLASLQRLSDVPLPMCTEFLRDLRVAELLITQPLTPPAATAASVHQATAEQGAGRGASRPESAATPSGLFARIRARFGLQPAWSR